MNITLKESEVYWDQGNLEITCKIILDDANIGHVDIIKGNKTSLSISLDNKHKHKGIDLTILKLICEKYFCL